MSNRIEVCKTNELPPGERKIITANNISIGVFNLDGDYHALLNTCTHQNGPVCEGKIQREICGRYDAAGERVVEFFSDTYTVACPWHGWEFDIETGEHIGDATATIPTYDVVEEAGTIYIEY